MIAESLIKVDSTASKLYSDIITVNHLKTELMLNHKHIFFSEILFNSKAHYYGKAICLIVPEYHS